MTVIEIANQGPLITATNYWDSELARAGKLFVSVNAGAVRVLLPSAMHAALADMGTAKEGILSRGPWPAERREEAVELLFDDGTDAPFALHLSPESFDLLPAEPEVSREWVCSVWIAKDGRPHKSLERVCHWRRVERIPWLKPWKA